jgi:hypothetical protein
MPDELTGGLVGRLLEARRGLIPNGPTAGTRRRQGGDDSKEQEPGDFHGVATLPA